jgi:uncharacterized protein YbjT (DUF2867 family)
VILVIGSRSKIGSALAEDLLARGEQVRALVRPGERHDGTPSETDTVTGDLADDGSLVAAMTGADKDFLLSSPTLTR